MTDEEDLPLWAAIGGLIVIALTYVINAMDRQVFPSLLSGVSQDYHFDLATGGLMATIFTLGLGLGGLPSGYLFELWSRKSVAIAGIVIYSLSTILTCHAFGALDMALLRVVGGVGEALQNVAIFTIAGAYFPRRRTLAFGVINIAYAAGSFIGPRWGAYLMVTGQGWRTPLNIYGIIGLLSAAVLYLLVPKRMSEKRASERMAGGRPGTAIPDRLVNRNTVLLAIASMAGGLAAYGYLGLYPTFLRTEVNFSAQEAGNAASMYGIGAGLGVVCGFLADRISQKWITIGALAALAVIGYAIFHIALTPFWQSVLSLAQGAAFSGFLFVNNYSLMQRSVQGRLVGQASGLMLSSVNLPAAASGFLLAELVKAYGWGTATLLQASALLIAPILLMLLFDLARTSSPQPAALADQLRR